MNPNEIYELQLQLIEIINGLWEIWLALTFAFIVAFHLGRNVIGRGVTYVSCFLFAGASVLVTLRYLDYGMMIRSFNLQLLEAGYEGLPQAPWTKYGIYNVLTLLIILVGRLRLLPMPLEARKTKINKEQSVRFGSTREIPLCSATRH